MARTEKREAAERERFLTALSETASVTKACELARLPRRTVYNWRRTDQGFAQAWEAALDMGTDALEDEAIRRAYHGTGRPVFQGKELVGHVRDYSDTLLIFMLKARRPNKYRDRAPMDQTLPGLAEFHEMMKRLTQRSALPIGSRALPAEHDRAPGDTGAQS